MAGLIDHLEADGFQVPGLSVIHLVLQVMISRPMVTRQQTNNIWSPKPILWLVDSRDVKFWL